jgi:hypothetical protein
VLFLAAAFIVFLAYLTMRAIVDNGIDALTLISLVVLVILGFGVLGALGSSFDD